MRLYLNQAITVGETVALPASAHHHVVTVCRSKPGETVLLFNGSGREFIGTLSISGRKNSSVSVHTEQAGLPPSPLNCHLGIGLSTGHRFELAIQKATELGVSSITPLVTEKSVKHKHSDKKQQHWQQILISASEQSGRSDVPTCHPPCSLEQWCANRQDGLRLISSLQQSPIPLIDHPTPHSLAVLIGPASGFTDEEEAIAQANGFQAMRLGPRVLRTETACFAAMSLVQSHWGDL